MKQVISILVLALNVASVRLRRDRPPAEWPWQPAAPHALLHGEPIVDSHEALSTWGSHTTTTPTPLMPASHARAPNATRANASRALNATLGMVGMATIEEPKLPEPPTELLEEVPDYPQPVEQGSVVWGELLRQAETAVAAINAKRAFGNLSAVHGFEARYGWAVADAHAAFKICAHAVVDGEPTFLTVTTAEGDDGVLVQSVTPAEALLGARTLAELSHGLPAGETLEEPADDAAEFPCNAEAAERMAQRASRRGPQTAFGRPVLGLVESRSALPGRSKRLARSLLRADNLPAAYNSRAAHPECAFPVLDQGSCGSCYAFAAAAMAGERLCIATGEMADPLSQQELVSCGSSGQAEYATPWCMKDSTGDGEMRKFTNGCNGATSFNALMYLHLFGLPTRACVPYVSGGGGKGVDHFETGSGGRVPRCSALEAKECRVERAAHRMSVPIPCPPGDIECIKAAIHSGGPVLASFTVTEEFRDNYPKGDPGYVYMGGTCDRPETPVGGHAVVLFGWGTSGNGTEYWLARNSWGTDWGSEGIFKIKHGAQGIEEKVLFASADTEEISHLHGECVQVHAAGGQCVLVNLCASQVRSVDVQFYGSERNCGSWSKTYEEFHPSQVEVIEGLYCSVVRDEYVRDVPDEKFYLDRTSDYPSYGCVLQNNYAGAGTAFVCCGKTCMSSRKGSLAVFPSYACSQIACEESGGSLYERVDDK